MSILRDEIRKEHNRAELERLRAGFEGCGCTECQELYATLNLSWYGERVKKDGNIISISAGKSGADLWDKYHTETPPDSGEGFPKTRNGVSKITSKEIIPDKDIQAQETGIMKQRGRPRKQGEFSRVTRWRRAKELQGLLL